MQQEKTTTTKQQILCIGLYQMYCYTSNKMKMERFMINILNLSLMLNFYDFFRQVLRLTDAV